MNLHFPTGVFTSSPRRPGFIISPSQAFQLLPMSSSMMLYIHSLILDSTRSLIQPDVKSYCGLTVPVSLEGCV